MPAKKQPKKQAKPSPTASNQPAKSDPVPDDEPTDLEVLQASLLDPSGVVLRYKIEVVSQEDVIVDQSNQITFFKALQPSQIPFTIEQFKKQMQFMVSDPVTNSFTEYAQNLMEAAQREVADKTLQLPDEPPVSSPDTLEITAQELENN
jgi:hypothetical protein